MADAERLFNTQQFDSSLQVYDALIAQYPDTLSLYYNRGLCLYRLGKLNEAITDFDYCIGIDSLHKDARYMKALALDKKGEQEASVEELTALQRIDAGYDNIQKRIKNYNIAVYVSRNWYYMLAMAFLLIVFLATVATLKTSRKV